MHAIASLVRRYPLVTFFAIAYATSFAGGYLSDAYPSDWWALFVYGPFFAGLIVTAILGGRGLKEWFSRIVRWRAGWQWYAVALLLPVLLQAVALVLNLVLGGALRPNAQPSNLLLDFIVWLLFIGLAEEPGFRGFALVRLLIGRPVLTASLILGVLHTIWHLPLFVSGSESLVIVPIILSGAVLTSWVFVNAQGSVLLTMLLHASVNTARVFFSAFLTEPAAEQQLILLAVVYAGAAIALVAVAGPSLTRAPKPALQPAASPEG